MRRLFPIGCVKSSALAIAIFSAILAIRTQTHLSALSGEKVGEALKQYSFLLATNDTFFVAAIVLMVSIPLSLLLKQRKSKDTLKKVKNTD